MSGTLHLVGTPIGNLGDFSPRAHETLASVGLIACEDTRRTGLLLSKHGIANPGMVVMNEHTEQKAAKRIVDTLAAGDHVAIVTDAGMPVISDPGAVAVAAAVDAGFDVIVIPGPTAVSAAVALAGFATTRYAFEGFLPRKGGERRARLAELASEQRMVVLYESPHRIERTLGDLAETMGADRRCVVARELTKLHEDVWRGPLGGAAHAHGDPRGEYVIVVDEAPPLPEASDEVLLEAIEAARAEGMSTKDAASRVAERYDVARNRVYALATR